MRLTLDMFAPHLGASFDVQMDDGTVLPLTLTSAAPAPAASEDQAQTAFNLDFTGPVTPVLDPLTYSVDVPDVGQVHLFISPHAQDDTGTHYYVVVN